MNKITVNENNGQQTVSARELHEKLEITDRFSRWFDSLLKYGFIKDIDFTSVKTSTLVNNGAERELQDYQITIEMAKQICMLQRSEKGKVYREYFLKLERAWNTPEAVMARALQVANRTLDNLKLEVENQQKIIQEQKPKVEFYDDVTGSNNTIDMGEVAKVLNIKNIGRNKLFEILRNKNILQQNNQPYQKFIDIGYFRVIESKYSLPNGDVKINLKTVVFQKGLDFIRKTLKKYA